MLARVRGDLSGADPFVPATAAGLAILEVLDPASGDVAVQEVLLRSTWAALRSWAPSRVAELLLAVDDVFGRGAPA